jgi:hypothetical protein
MGSRRRPLVEDGAATFEGNRTRRFEQPGEGLRRLEKMEGHVHGIDQRLIEEPEPADDLRAIRAGEEKGIGVILVRLLLDPDERIAPRTREHGGGDEGKPPGRKYRHGRESPDEALADPEQAEAVPGYRFDPPRPGDVGIACRGRLVPLGQTAEKDLGERVWMHCGRSNLVRASHKSSYGTVWGEARE